MPRRSGVNPGTYRFIVAYDKNGTPHVAYETAIRTLCMSHITLWSDEEYDDERSAVDCPQCRFMCFELTVKGFRHWWSPKNGLTYP